MRNKKRGFRDIYILVCVFALLGTASEAMAKKWNESGDFYVVDIDRTIKKNKVKVVITVTGKKGFHINKLFPWKITLTKLIKTKDKIGLHKETYKKKDAKEFSEKKAVFIIKYKEKKDVSVSLELKFSMCDKKECRTKIIKIKL